MDPTSEVKVVCPSEALIKEDKARLASKRQFRRAQRLSCNSAEKNKQTKSIICSSISIFIHIFRSINE